MRLGSAVVADAAEYQRFMYSTYPLMLASVPSKGKLIHMYKAVESAQFFSGTFICTGMPCPRARLNAGLA